MSLPNGTHAVSSMYPGNFAQTPQRPPEGPPNISATSMTNGAFDIFVWHPAYMSCQKYFVDHAQHDSSVQAVAALVNILLPFQWSSHPVTSSSGTSSNPPGPTYAPFASQPSAGPLSSSQNQQRSRNLVSLVPYIRRLVVSGFDKEPVLHGFFGNDWRTGIGTMQECERRNYLFAAKSGGWAKVKSQYDMGPHETVPFLRPPQEVQLAEIEAAEKQWSQWLATEDWMVGPRAPENTVNEGGHGNRTENDQPRHF